jgi:hypothetical protein
MFENMFSALTNPVASYKGTVMVSIVFECDAISLCASETEIMIF